MKKVCILLTVLAMLMSMCIAISASEDIVLLPSDVDYQTGVSVSSGEIAKIRAGGRFGFEGVDLTGIKSITVEGTCNYEGRNNEILQVRVGSPDNGGTVIAYVRMDDDTKSSFSADIEVPVTGVQNLYFVAQFSGVSAPVAATKVNKVILSKEPSGNEKYVPIPDSAIIDNYHDTWVAVDGMGRAVADYEEVGDLRGEETEIGMFYWNWHARGESNVRIPWKINAEFPEAYDDYEHPAWDLKGRYYWNEPIFGYYDNLDYWVYRKQAILLANADVDVIFFDGTNMANVWYAGLKVQYEAWRDARESGVDAPGISWITSWKTDRTQAVKYIYQEFFREGRYSDLWYYRDGKPMIITDRALVERLEYPNDSIDGAITREAFNFFSMYRTASRIEDKIGPNDQLMWLDVYPQSLYGQDASGRIQFVSLGIAKNESYVWGPGTVGVFSDPYTMGRSYTVAFGEDWREGAYRENYFFLEQASRVLDVDPAFVFVDGWNEWIAGRQHSYSGVENSFVDTYDNEGSRDIEPTRGELKDDTYCQFVDFVRKYQGVRPAPLASAEKTIDLAGDIAQWNDVSPEFINDNTDFERDSTGYVNPDTGERFHYTTKVNNAISRAKVARDSENFYFMAKTTRPIVEGTENWMNLYINVDRNYATGFEGYDYVVNFTGAGVISKFADKAYTVTDIGNVSYKVTGDTLVIVVPKALIGETGKADLEFKWTDSVDPKGDIVEFYNGGSVAPMGRFNFLYTEIAQVALSEAEKSAFTDGAMIGEGKIKMIADGAKMKVYEPDTRCVPVMDNGVLYYPARALNDILGYGETKVEFEADDNILHVSTHKLDENDDISDEYWIYSEVGSLDARVNGYHKALTNPVKMINGIPYVPVTYLSDCLSWKLYDAGDGIYAMSKTGISEEIIAGAKAHLG